MSQCVSGLLPAYVHAFQALYHVKLQMCLESLNHLQGQIAAYIHQHVAEEQLKANMPWIIARAVVRRAAKAAGAAVIQHGVAARNNWWLGFLAG